jgi:hypothetical protein
MLHKINVKPFCTDFFIQFPFEFLKFSNLDLGQLAEKK